MRETSHENLTRFVGACIDGPIAIIEEYCPKGSLRDVLANSSLNLDWIFRYSLISDIVSGLHFLHYSDHIFHGRLKSTNCLVDSRFCVKISDFGLRELRGINIFHRNVASDIEMTAATSSTSITALSIDFSGFQRESDDVYAPLYVSPDLISVRCKCLKSKNKTKICSECYDRFQKGDVYSFAIILQEIITRKEPFYPYSAELNIPDIVSKILSEDIRPIVSKDKCSIDLHCLMTRCWARDADYRPDFGAIKRDMRTLAKSASVKEDLIANATLTEKLLQRMEHYANDLESIVEQRTKELNEEKKKSEELLYQILPRVVANQLKMGESVVPDYFDSVSIYFSDIVGFTTICSESTPMQVVDLLNDLYTCFDSIISDFDVYKVETIGDAYMVVSGVPERNGNEHVRQIARMALRIRECVEKFEIRHRENEKLMIRIGIHTGPCCAGVVGHKRPRYCLFGDTVNTASRMESTGEALKIHISESSKRCLDVFGTFQLTQRGIINIKGKGLMNTYWLINEIL
ncbi:Atrial natriuretic peptide receptor 2-like protein [Dinothrombium tinctorium]|uniref:Guanylate cyclase n=1 Tax=Dinothrombium tinctorium TaxID=1965070 RepID=A0A3S3NY50_9ACAR|nr:Atrial natriuretic peptide receptor 2-like protein [Dinothrombium tinctorium]RWS08356.1 Atrial natriuretic peptide receptor 2-like protein [Dinothrombium tinctorium]